MTEQLYRIRPIEWVEKGVHFVSACGRFRIKQGVKTCQLKHIDFGANEYIGRYSTLELAMRAAELYVENVVSRFLEPVPNPAIDRSAESV